MIGRHLSHYRILEELSRGGMGVVYRALDVKLEREVAIKVLPSDLVADAERRRRFEHEARAASKLNHPHIAVVYEIDEADGLTFIAMELVRGGTLADAMAGEGLAPARALDVAIDVAEGLAAAHERGVVHRDLKPSNIMLTEEGRAKIIDFGLAKLVEPASEASESETLLKNDTEPGMVIGTVCYMSPEQARGSKVDARSDVFAFGVVLYESLAGRTPFRGATRMDTLSAILKDLAPPLPLLRPEVPAEAHAELQRVLDRCLARDPDSRYQSMKEVARDVRAARRRLESAPTPAPANGSPRLLLVEDEYALARGLMDNFRAEGYTLRHVERGDEVVEAVAAFHPDLLVLDLMLPGRSGLDVLRDLRAAGLSLPILVLTAKGEVVDRVVGLELGADDYLAKPFAVRELLARVRALLRRDRARSASAATPALAGLVLGGVRFDFRALTATGPSGPVDLTIHDILVLRMLAEQRGAVVSRIDIVEEVCGLDSEATLRTVDNHIVALRRAIGDDPRHPRWLQTVRGEGYRLAADGR